MTSANRNSNAHLLYDSKTTIMPRFFTNDILADIGYRLKSERSRLGLTQEQLSERLGVSRPTVAAYEAGRSPSDVRYLTQLGAIGADVIYVLTGRRSNQVAEDYLDWKIAGALMKEVELVAEEKGMRLTAAQRMGFVKFLYGKSVSAQSIDRKDVAGAVTLLLDQ